MVQVGRNLNSMLGIAGRVYPPIALDETSPRSRSNSPFSETSTVPDPLQASCTHLYGLGQGILDKGNLVSRPPATADSTSPPSRPQRDASGHRRGRSHRSSKIFRSIPVDASAPILGNAATSHARLESPAFSGAQHSTQQGDSANLSVHMGALETSRTHSGVPSCPEIELTPRQARHSSQQSQSSRPRDVSFFTEQLYDGMADNSRSRDIWETPPSPLANVLTESSPSQSPAGRSATLQIAAAVTVTNPTALDISEREQRVQSTSNELFRSGDARSRFTELTASDTHPERSSFARPAARSSAAAARLADMISERGSTGRRSTSLHRTTGSRSSPEQSRSEVERASSSRNFESIQEGSEAPDTPQQAQQAQRKKRRDKGRSTQELRNVSVNDHGTISAAESGEMRMNEPEARQTAPFAHREARPSLQHGAHTPSEASTDFSREASMSAVTAVSHQRSQVCSLLSYNAPFSIEFLA